MFHFSRKLSLEKVIKKNDQLSLHRSWNVENLSYKMVRHHLKNLVCKIPNFLKILKMSFYHILQPQQVDFDETLPVSQKDQHGKSTKLMKTTRREDGIFK